MPQLSIHFRRLSQYTSGPDYCITNNIVVYDMALFNYWGGGGGGGGGLMYYPFHLHNPDYVLPIQNANLLCPLHYTDPYILCPLPQSVE